MPKRKTITAISLLLFSGFIGTSLISFFVSRASLVNFVQSNELPLTGDNIYSEIQRDLLQPIIISSLMAQDTFLRDWTVQGETDTGKITRYLNEIKIKYNAFTSFFVSDKTLNYYHSGGILKKVKTDQPRDEWYFRVRAMKDLFEINVDPDMANRDTMTIFINYKVFDYNKNFIGATGVGLNVSAVKQLIINYQRRYNCRIYFVNKMGDIVLQSADHQNDNLSIHNIPGLEKHKNTIFSSQSGNMTYSHQGKTILLHTRYIPEFQWHLFVEQTENRAVRGVALTLAINLVICLIISMVILKIANLALTRSQNKLETMAVTDKLTGIFNRQILDIHLDLALKEFSRHKKPFSLVVTDIDHFKIINDTYGHLAGDAVLCYLTDQIKLIVRDSDILSRWGGDEFIIILNDCTLENAVTITEKIQTKINENTISYKKNIIKSTISFGVTQCRRDDTSESILARADACLYAAKEKGRNRIESV
jgi:diguanylate cyclase (GGDEF)-like protein